MPVKFVGSQCMFSNCNDLRCAGLAQWGDQLPEFVALRGFSRGTPKFSFELNSFDLDVQCPQLAPQLWKI